MKEIWKKHKSKIVAGLYGFAICLFLAVFVIFLAVPAISRIEEKTDKIQETIIDGQVAQARMEKIPEMEADRVAFQGKKDALNVILDTDKEVDFIKSLESIAQETGNSISFQVDDTLPAKSTSSSKSKKAEGILDKLSSKNYISLHISLEGNYPGLVNFIHKLENNHYYVNLISLSVATEKKAEEKTNQSPVLDSSSSQSGLFSSSKVSSSSQNEASNLVEKEVLKSTLNVVVYTN